MVKSLKQRIAAGEIIVGLRAMITDARRPIASILGDRTYDFLYIDGQHTAFSEDQLITFCAQAEELGLPVQFRIPHTRQTYLIGRYLDLGLSGILVPEVEEERTVAEAIAYAYYPQVGRRSWGGVARRGVRAAGGQADRLSYSAWWNSEVILAIQLESVAAISNARQLAMPGVDFVAFGPNDLQFSLEGHPNYPLRTVDACMENVAEQLRESGVRLGMGVTTTPAEQEKYMRMGVTVFQEAAHY
jgi:2-keto-3-deoxy-L-rhamnonate aldolase RhmA